MRLVARLTIAGLCAWLGVAMQAAPARAIAYGGYSLRASLDTWHDDNLARGIALTSADLPNGNQDFGLQLGLSMGNVVVFSPAIDTWLIVGLHGTRGWFYPSLGNAWASLMLDTEWHLNSGQEAYWLLGPSFFWGNGTFYTSEIGFVQPVWPGADVRGGVGGAYYAVDTAGASYGLPSIGIGLDQVLPSKTLLGLRYALQAQIFSASQVDPRHQVFASVTQPLGAGFEVHAYYLETIDLSDTTPYWEGYVDLGVGYDF